MVDIITKYTDYLANEKIPVKDISVTNHFIEIFKWENILLDQLKIGKAEGLLRKCLTSESFWY